MERPFFSVIIPCLNEEAILEECVNTAKRWFSRNQVGYEIIIVDDGSTDRTYEIAARLSAADSQIVVIKEPGNFGVGKAMSDGLAAATGEFAFLQCADMPFNIEDLSELKPLMDASCDVLVIARKDRSANSPFRKLTSLTNYYLIRGLFQVPIPDFQFVQFYRVARIKAFLPLVSEGSFAPPELQIKCWKAGLRFRMHSLPFHRRTAGDAKYGTPRRLLQSVKEILRYRIRTLT
jgi:glycosyltransferase involved in cell wall biosynthesis